VLGGSPVFPAVGNKDVVTGHNSPKSEPKRQETAAIRRAFRRVTVVGRTFLKRLEQRSCIVG
jgi:hypothetical protein